jgi:Uma2 family endonuclease
MSVVVERTYTPEELLSMPDRTNYELVDGHLVERNVSVLSSWVGGRLDRVLGGFVEDHDLGWTWPADQGYICFPDAPGKVRKMDVSFIRKERLPEGLTSEGYLYIPPDLAVEVVSPNDLWYDVVAKLEEYLNAGVPLIWVIDPEVRIVHVYRGDGSVSKLHEKDELSGEDVVPGFRCPVSAIFPKKATKSQAPG